MGVAWATFLHPTKSSPPRESVGGQVFLCLPPPAPFYLGGNNETDEQQGPFNYGSQRVRGSELFFSPVASRLLARA